MTTRGASTIAHIFAGIPVADYDSSLGWYERLFGRPPDIIVTHNEAMREVVHGGWIYVVGDSTRAGKALVAVLVDDLENWVAELTQRGVAARAIDSQPGVAQRSDHRSRGQPNDHRREPEPGQIRSGSAVVGPRATGWVSGCARADLGPSRIRQKRKTVRSPQAAKEGR
jgi:hypothetical protein